MFRSLLFFTICCISTMIAINGIFNLYSCDALEGMPMYLFSFGITNLIIALCIRDMEYNHDSDYIYVIMAIYGTIVFYATYVIHICDECSIPHKCNKHIYNYAYYMQPINYFLTAILSLI